MSPTNGIFTPDQVDQLVEFATAHGYATLRGVYRDEDLARAEAELVAAQTALVAGTLDSRYRTDILDDPEAEVDGESFAHYVCFATKVAPAAAGLVAHPGVVAVGQAMLGADAWVLDYEQFGVVYQDARPDPGSGYSRISWHTDRQSGPHLAMWPAVAFTIHFDPTSPANGFLRVVPDSHLRGTDGIIEGFGRIPGETALYQERGDVLFHHCDLWHAAARGTAEGPDAIRRHLRGSYHCGERLPEGHGVADFVKNALR